MQNELVDGKSLAVKNFKLAGQCFMKTLLCAVMCFVVFFSMTTIAVGFGTKEIGYTIYQKNDDSKTYTKIYTHYNSQGKDTKLEQYTSGTSSEKYYKESIRSSLSTGSKTFIAVISQIIGLILLLNMLYSSTWKLGDGDENQVSFGHMKKDNLRGLKIGLLASVPYALFWLLLLLSKTGLFFDSFPKLFKLLYYHMFYLTNLTLGPLTRTASQLSWSGAVLAVLLLLPLPLFCALGYMSGYRHFSIRDKIIYKNDKKGR